MAGQGYISLHRKVMKHWIWEDEVYDRRSAWIDLLLSANYKENKFVLGLEIVEVERGSFITSEVKLMKKWGWSKTKVRNFLSLLIQDNMIEKISDRKKTTIKIVNYSVYQDSQTTEEPIEDRKKTARKPIEDREKTARRPQEDTNNKENKENKVNKENKENNKLGSTGSLDGEDIHKDSVDNVDKSKTLIPSSLVKEYAMIKEYTDHQELRDALLGFVEMRKKAKKPVTERAIKMLLKSLDTLATDAETRVRIVDKSTMRGWQGFFPLENKEDERNEHGGKFKANQGNSGGTKSAGPGSCYDFSSLYGQQ